MSGRLAARLPAAALLLACGCASSGRVPPPSRPSPFLGVFTDEAAQRDDGLWTKPGLLVLEVFQDSPAALAGIWPGDVLLQLGAAPVAGEKDFDAAMAAASAGDRLRIVFQRGGKRLDKEAILVERGALPKALQPRDLPAAARTLIVSEDGRGSYRTLAAAIYRSRQGDSLEILPGEYRALHLFRDGVSIHASPAAVVDAIDGSHQPAGVSVAGLRVRPSEGGGSRYAALFVGASNVELEGLDVAGGATGLRISGSDGVRLKGLRVGGALGPGIEIDRSRGVRIESSRIEDGRVGVEARESTLSISSSTIVQNRRPGALPEEPNAGLHLSNCEAVVSRTTIADNSRPGAASIGIWLEGPKPVSLSRNIVAGHAEGLRLAAGSAPRLDRNDLWGDAAPVVPAGTPPGTDFSSDPRFADPEAGDYTIRAARPARAEPPASRPAAPEKPERTPKRKLRFDDEP